MNKRSILIIIIITVLLLTLGLSYAYFTANLTGTEDSTTITVTGGSMNINYDGGANINIVNIIPNDNPAAIKTFTVTGNNTTDIDMSYQISLVVEENTFSEDALKYKLISTNTDNNGEVAPTVNDLTNIGAGAKTIEFGIGYFDNPTGGNKVHTYNLEIYFPNAAYNQNIDQEKEIKGYIKIENHFDPCAGGQCLKDKILAQGGGASEIESKVAPNFNVINGTSGIYAAEDEYGTSYYYRGLKTNLNNNMIWGGFQWKIVRINGDDSVRLIYNGTEDQFNINGLFNDIGDSTQIGTGTWNTINDAKYLGYMYGNSTPSTVRNGTTSSAATYNEKSSNVKLELDNWYKNNILGKVFENQIIDNIFCNDRQLANEIGGPNSGPGYGNTGVETRYAGNYRLNLTKNPTLKCGLQNDRFNINDTTKGNGALTYPIGLITADELSMGGLKYNTIDDTNYLYNNQNYWTMTPFVMNADGFSTMFFVLHNGNLNNITTYFNYGLRPVISISSKLKVTGTGSTTDPYKVI